MTPGISPPTDQPDTDPESACWAVRATEPDRAPQTYGPMPRAEADTLATELDGIGWRTEVVDLLADTRARFPVGARARHITTGRTATVELCPPAHPVAQGQPVAHVLMRPDEPLVYLGAPYYSWFVARWLEPTHPIDLTSPE